MANSYIEKRPKAFTINLSVEHAIAQRNYGRLLRLFSGWDKVDELRFFVNEKRVTLSVEQRDAYSTVFAIAEAQSASSAMVPTQCRMRAYHDVQMLEVIEWNGARRFKPRYRYPNAKMMAKDEKWQLNRFIGEWLDHCIRFGHAEHSVTFENPSSTNQNIE